MDMTTGELRKATENGEVLAEDLLPKLAKELMIMANSGDQLEKAMNNTNSALNRFSNNVTLANVRINEAGLDKGIRDLANSASDFIARADELWSLMGGISPVIFAPFRALFELFGAISDRFSGFADTVKANESTFKVLAAVTASLFGWSRKLLFAFVLLPAAFSNIAKAIDGEQLTWTQWALTLGTIAATLGFIIAKLKWMKGARPPSFMAPGASGGGAARTGFGFQNAPIQSQRTVMQAVRGVLGKTLGIAGAGYEVFDYARNTNVAEYMRTGETPLDRMYPDIGRTGALTIGEQQQARQAIISGDVTFNINGENSKEIADEVLRVIHQDVIRPASINDPSQEK